MCSSSLLKYKAFYKNNILNLLHLFLFIILFLIINSFSANTYIFEKFQIIFIILLIIYQVLCFIMDSKYTKNYNLQTSSLLSLVKIACLLYTNIFITKFIKKLLQVPHPRYFYTLSEPTANINDLR